MLTKPIHFISIAIPVIATAVLAMTLGSTVPLYCYMLMLFGIPLLVVLVGLLLSHMTNKCTEYLGAYVTDITHYEPWDEQVLRYRQVADGKDSNDMTKYRTETYYETVYHPDSYTYNTNIGKHGIISEMQFNHWQNMLNDIDPTFVDMHRNYHTINGNAWRYTWNGDREFMVPLTFKHRYFNPLKYSNSIFNIKSIDKEVAEGMGLYEHPGIMNHWYQKCLLGDSQDQYLNITIQRLNAELGWLHQFRLFVLVFNGYKNGIEIVQKQKAYWNGGNRNEFVVCVGIDKETNDLIWHDSFSWCKDHKLEAMTRNYLASKDKFDCYKLCMWLETVVPDNWERRNFKEFKYLDTTLPAWASALLVTLSIVATLSIGLLAI